MEATPGDEGGDEIVLTISNLHVEGQEDTPASGQGHADKADSPKKTKKAKGRPVRSPGDGGHEGAAVFP